MRLLGSRSVALSLVVAGGLLAQTPGPSTDLSDADNAIAGFRQLSKDLPQAVKRFYSHLDQTMATHGRAADADVAGGAEDPLRAIRKCVAFRMLAARSEEYAPEPVADMDQIQDLIMTVRKRADESSAILRRLLVVSIKDLDPRKDAQMKTRHNQLLKARSAAEDAAAEAYLALPVNLSEFTSDEDRRQKARDLLASASLELQSRPSPISTGTPPMKAKNVEPAIPLRIDRRRRFTLVNDDWYRLALTDSGRVDENGRRLFYEEEWFLRGKSVIRMRRRVAVDTKTGRHSLIKQYPPLELHGPFDELYWRMDRDYLWYLEPVEGDVRPSWDEVQTALADVARSREAIAAAARDFGTAARESLARHDQRCASGSMTPVDVGLSDSLREALFAIRSHLAGVPAILETERHVRQAISDAVRSIANLESLAAWANRVAPDDPAAQRWEQLLQQADCDIDLARTAEGEALVSLPPNSPNKEDKFPALQKDLIVRIRWVSPGNQKDGSVRLLQEIWRLEKRMPGVREARRTATLVVIDRTTGDQIVAGARTKYYIAEPGELLEEIFDDNAADELPMGDGS